MNSDAIDSNICCDVSHGGLVIELVDPSHQAIFEWGYHCPLEKESILSRYHQEAYEALHPYHMVEIHLWNGSKALHDEEPLYLSLCGGVEVRVLIVRVAIAPNNSWEHFVDSFAAT